MVVSNLLVTDSFRQFLFLLSRGFSPRAWKLVDVENSATAPDKRGVRDDKAGPRIDKWRKAPGGRDTRSIHIRGSSEEVRFMEYI